MKNNIIEPFEEDKLTPNQIFNKVFKIFQTIDLLNTRWWHKPSMVSWCRY